MLINATQAAAGLKSTVEAVAAARANGASWSQILGDPVMLAQFAGALAGAAGAGGSAIPQLRQVLTTSGLVLSGAQIAALGTALATYQDDPALGQQGNFSKRADLLAAVLTPPATFLANEVSAHAPQPGATGRSRPAERAPSARRRNTPSLRAHRHAGEGSVRGAARQARRTAPGAVVAGADRHGARICQGGRVSESTSNRGAS